MEPSPILIGLDIGLAFAILFVLDRNVYHAFYLILSGIPTWIELRIRQTILGIRLRIDRLGVQPGVLGRVFRELQLRQIRNNPAYKEFFNEQVQSDSLQKGED